MLAGMRKRFALVVAIYDWIARLHFGIFGLGAAGVIATLGTAGLAAVATLPLWVLVGLGVSLFFMSLGAIGWVGARFGMGQSVGAIRAAGDQDERVRSLRRAVDTLITWFYREDNPGGLSDEALLTQPAQRSYGQDLYRTLGLDGEFNPSGPIGVRPPPPGQAHTRAPLPSKQSVENSPVGEAGLRPTGDLTIKLIPGGPVHPPGVQGFEVDEIPPRIAEMCERRAGLIAQGDKISRDLRALPTRTTTGDDRSYSNSVQAWIHQVHKYAQVWWASSPENVAAEGAALNSRARPSLPPQWREPRLKEIEDRLAWLDRHGSDQC